MYWTDWGTPAKIERASMDGLTRETLHNTDLVWPNAITMDYQSQTLYWLDAKLDKLESSFVNGSDRRTISTEFVYHPFSVAFYKDVLYWSDWLINQVVYASISSPGMLEGLVPVLPKAPMGIRIVALDAQPISKWCMSMAEEMGIG